jgi:hypothetical protein
MKQISQGSAHKKTFILSSDIDLKEGEKIERIAKTVDPGSATGSTLDNIKLYRLFKSRPYFVCGLLFD